MVTTGDKLEIIEVLAGANRAADDKDVDRHASFYIEGGTIEGDMQASGNREDFRSELKSIFDGEPGLKRHVGSGHLFEQDGDKVVVKSLLTVLEGDGAPSVVATADITDELVRAEDGWKIARHTVCMDPGTKAAMAEASQ